MSNLMNYAHEIENTDTVKPIDKLRAAMPKLTIERDKQFAADLINGFEEYGNWTPKQEVWVHRLIDRANGIGPTARPSESIGDLSKLFVLFEAAGNTLQYPAVRLRGPAGMPNLKLSIAGERARCPGTINVAQDAAFGAGAWYGRITRDGTFEPGRDAAPPALLVLLRDLARDPRRVMREHGRGRLARVA